MEPKKAFYGSADGVSTIHACIWVPASDTPVKGIIQIVHGMSEHILRYAEFAEFMVSNGYVVCGNDHLGHGKSANGNFGHIGGSGAACTSGGHKLLAKDVHKLTVAVKREFNAPVILIGLGIGSLIARYIIAAWNMEYSGAIFSGTSGGTTGLNALHRVMAKVPFGDKREKRGEKEALWIDKRIHGKNSKHFRRSEHGDSWLTRDETQFAAYLADPLCGFPLTYQTCMDILKLLRIVNSRSWPMRIPPAIPILIFSGLNDPMGNFGKGVLRVYGDLINAGCENVNITFYKEARHELLFELNRFEVFEDINKWLEGAL